MNYNEDNRAVIYTKGNVAITATEKVVINDTGVKAKALSAYGDANVTIDGGKQTIINGEITADGLGPVLQSDGNVEHQDNGIADNINVLIKGKEIVVDASLEAEEGVFARGDSTGIDNAVITVGDANTEKVIIRDVDTGVFAWNGGSKVEVNSDTLVISADGNSNDSGMGICAYNESTDGNKFAVIDVNASETEITVQNGNFAYGVYANGKSNVNVAGDVEIIASGTSAFGVEASNSAVVELGGIDSNIKLNVNADNGLAYGIYADDDSTVSANGNIDINATGYSAYGLEVLNGSTVQLGATDKDVSITATSTGERGEALSSLAKSLIEREM